MCSVWAHRSNVSSPWTPFFILHWDLSLAAGTSPIIVNCTCNQSCLLWALADVCIGWKTLLGLISPVLEHLIAENKQLLSCILALYLFIYSKGQGRFWRKKGKKKVLGLLAPLREIQLKPILKDSQRETTIQCLCFNSEGFFCCCCCVTVHIFENTTALPCLYVFSEYHNFYVTVLMPCAAELLARSLLWRRFWSQCFFNLVK